MFEKKRTLFLLVGILMLIQLSSVGWSERKPTFIPLVEEEESLEAIPVEVVTASRRDVRSVISATGTIFPLEMVTVSSKVSGEIKRMSVKEGQSIAKGNLIAQVDDTVLKLQAKQAAINRDYAAEEYERARKLYDQGVIPVNEFNKAENAFENTRVSLELLKKNLEYTRITAPISGVVVKKFISAGEMVGPGLPVATIIDIDKVRVEVSIAEQEVARVRLNLIAEVRIDAYPGRVFSGKVVYISPSVDPVTRTFTTKVEVRNPGHELKSGMFARVNLIIAAHKGVVTLPLEAVLTEGEKSFLYVVEESIAHLRDVKLGLSAGDYVEIVSGVRAGEEVVVVGQEDLADGRRVEVVARSE